MNFIDRLKALINQNGGRMIAMGSIPAEGMNMIRKTPEQETIDLARHVRSGAVAQATHWHTNSNGMLTQHPTHVLATANMIAEFIMDGKTPPRLTSVDGGIATVGKSE